MAVLVIAEVDGQTTEGYDGMLSAIEPALRDARGFIAHGAGPGPRGWRTFEVWDTAEDAAAFFARHVHRHLPDGVRPHRTMVTLHRLIQADSFDRRAATAARP